MTLTARDIAAEDVGDAYLALEEAISGFIKLEIVNCASDGKKVSEGLDRYCRDILQNQQEIGDNIEKNLNELNKF